MARLRGRERRLRFAAARNDMAMTARLVADGVDVNAADWRGVTALARAAAAGHADVVRLLVDKGARVDPKDRDGWTPVLLAARGGHLAALRFLVLEGRARVFDDVRVDGYRRSALMLAAAGGHGDVAAFLLDQGLTDIHLDREGNDAESLARRAGHLGVVEVFATRRRRRERVLDFLRERVPELAAKDREIRRFSRGQGKLIVYVEWDPRPSSRLPLARDHYVVYVGADGPETVSRIWTFYVRADRADLRVLSTGQDAHLTLAQWRRRGENR